MKALIRTMTLGIALGVPALGAHAAPQEVEWWDFLAGGDGVRMKALIDDFNAEHPDIEITATTLEWGVPFYTKLRTASAVGEGPDIATYHLSRIPLALEEGVLSPIGAEDLADAQLSTDDFFAASIEAASSDGTMYGVPFDVHALILYYNKDLLEGSGFIGDDGKLTGIESVEDFGAALAFLADQGVETPVAFGSGEGGSTWRVFYTLFSQAGGQFMVDGEVLPGDNADKAAAVIDAMTAWRENGWSPEQAEYEAGVALFSSGKSGFHLNGVWEVPTFTDLHASGDLGFEWGAVEVPAMMGAPASWADSHAFVVPVQGDEPMSAEKRAAVMTVIGWMQRQSIRWADAGHIPAYKPVAESAEYAEMEPNATYASLADNAAYDPRSTVTGVASPTYDTAANIISPATHGYLTGAEAVEQIRGELQSMLQ